MGLVELERERAKLRGEQGMREHFRERGSQELIGELGRESSCRFVHIYIYSYLLGGVVL